MSDKNKKNKPKENIYTPKSESQSFGKEASYLSDLIKLTKEKASKPLGQKPTEKK